MELTDIDFKGLGRFTEQAASFEINDFRLPSPWDYCYTNGQVLLRVRHDGAGYLQVDPPQGVPLISGPPLMVHDNGNVTPNFLVWFVPGSRSGIPARHPREHANGRAGMPDLRTSASKAFTNFFLPALPLEGANQRPDHFRCDFQPHRALYTVRQDDWQVQTTLWVPPAGAAMVMTVRLTNQSAGRRSCAIMPALRPHLAPLDQAPWDVASWYQTCAFARVGGHSAFWVQTRDAGGNPARRLHAGLVSDFVPETFEVSYDRFVANGQWAFPLAVSEGKLALDAKGTFPWGKVGATNAVVGQQPVAAMCRTVELAAGETYEFTMVLAKLTNGADGTLPPPDELGELARFLKPANRAKALTELQDKYAKLFSVRRLDLPDEAMGRYVNEFLPLQAYWVSMLDRGWPVPFRGTRDAAQDATSIIAIDPGLARQRLIEILSHQRSDGWFPRAYFPCEPELEFPAQHVDAGVFAWELLWEYLCQTRDFGVLKLAMRWLDKPKASCVLEHVGRLFDYYLSPKNLGRHGLCKIRGGDWNDSVNLAGLEGKGESVMVSCQLVMALQQAARLYGGPAGATKSRAVPDLQGKGMPNLKAIAKKYSAAAKKMRDNLQRHAFNKSGYFNGVFSDSGKWAFSPADSDGKSRINGPANSFAVIAGVARGEARDSVFAALNRLKGPHGWRLFYPGIGHPPIPKLGRIGQGDLEPGMGENGTPYNHGSHGFLGRAAWSAGRGQMFYDVMRHMLPYDQQAHPTAVAKTAPYGVVNHWKEAIGMEGLGGDTFLSGSIATALRNFYEGMAGFRPELEAVVIDPVIPPGWQQMTAHVNFMGAEITINVRNPAGKECGVAKLTLDGKEITDRIDCPRLERQLAVIPIEAFKKGKKHTIEVVINDQ